MNNLTHRKARIADLPRIIELLLEDELGASRESKSAELDENYIKALHKIDSDPNQTELWISEPSSPIFKVRAKRERSAPTGVAAHSVAKAPLRLRAELAIKYVAETIATDYNCNVMINIAFQSLLSIIRVFLCVI